MRYLGIDYGMRRMGMAVADEETMIATPRGVILRNDDAQAIRAIGAIIAEEKIEQVIVGLPLWHDGAETQASREAREFAEKLKQATGAILEFENEMFTSRMANHAGVKKNWIDAASAAIILQSYLDRRHP